MDAAAVDDLDRGLAWLAKTQVKISGFDEMSLLLSIENTDRYLDSCPSLFVIRQRSPQANPWKR
jgi:hypothetical protein